MGVRFLTVLGLAPFVLRCDPGVSLEGTVNRMDQSPVANATVRTVCPPADSAYGDLSTTTNAKGAFSTHGLGSVDKDCTLEVAVPDQQVLKFRALDYCVDKGSTSCGRLLANIVVPF